MRTFLVLAFLIGCGGGSTGELGAIDPRCTSLCKTTEASCSAESSDCEQLCQLRVANLAPLCTTCLLDHSNGGTCSSGMICCPDPNFPNSAIDCATSCVGSLGVNPSGDHPICADICANSDATCSTAVAACLMKCDARVQGVSGLCALCLLDNASGGTCASGQVCCPSPSFPTTPAACANVCG